jgi:hypothetical protein
VDCGKDVRKEGKICSKCDEKLKIKKKIKKNETKGNYPHKMII